MRHLYIALIFLLSGPVHSQATDSSGGMTQSRLHDLFVEVGSEVLISGNSVQFTFDDARLICISDSSADRMRIISPVSEITDVDGEQLLIALAANFHSVLDARYAVSDGVLYAAFLHPLSSITEEEVLSAIRQVATARNTFGDKYTSGELFFGGG